MKGELHVMPTPGDRAQRQVLVRSRFTRFLELVNAQNPAVRSWPEFAWLTAEGKVPLDSNILDLVPSFCLPTKGPWKSMIDWINRAARLRRRGIDPATRASYRRARATLERLLSELYHLEQRRVAA